MSKPMADTPKRPARRCEYGSVHPMRRVVADTASRIWSDLREKDEHVSEKRVARLMRAGDFTGQFPPAWFVPQVELIFSLGRPLVWNSSC